jgi:hypothetical protein
VFQWTDNTVSPPVTHVPDYTIRLLNGSGCSCTIDFNRDGSINGDDLADYIADYFGSGSVYTCESATDVDNDHITTPDDLSTFISNFYNGCT